MAPSTCGICSASSLSLSKRLRSTFRDTACPPTLSSSVKKLTVFNRGFTDCIMPILCLLRMFSTAVAATLLASSSTLLRFDPLCTCAPSFFLLCCCSLDTALYTIFCSCSPSPLLLPVEQSGCCTPACNSCKCLS